MPLPPTVRDRPNSMDAVERTMSELPDRKTFTREYDPQYLDVAFSENLVKLRKLQRHSQHSLAKAIGVSAQSIANIEALTVSTRLTTLYRICRELEAPPSTMLLKNAVKEDGIDYELEVELASVRNLSHKARMVLLGVIKELKSSEL